MASKPKSPSVRRIINEAIEILQAFGVPLASATQRQREMSAMCFLAVVGVTHSSDWPSAGTHPGPALGTRQIIDFINTHFEEKISSGSYDDIRRKHLRSAVLAGVVIKSASNPNASQHDPTRGYGISPEHAAIIRGFGQIGWAGMAS